MPFHQARGACLRDDLGRGTLEHRHREGQAWPRCPVRLEGAGEKRSPSRGLRGLGQGTGPGNRAAAGCGARAWRRGPDLPQDRASSVETWGAAARPDRRGAAHRSGRRGTCLSGRSRATEEPRGSGQASQQEASLSRCLPERHPCSRGRAEDARGGGSAKRLRSSVAARGRGRAGAPRSVSLGVGPRRGSSC